MALSQSCIKLDVGKVGMTSLDMPSPGPGQALVRTRLSTVCGSDIHMVDDIPELPAGTPLGHEAVGEVVDAGEGVTSFRQSDRVVAACVFGCGLCARCQDGHLQLCERYGSPMNLLFGAQGEYFLVPNAELNMTKVPGDLSDEAVLFASDIMSTAFGAIEAADLRYGDSVAIFAQGPVGLCVTAAARARGAGLIVAVEGIPARAAMAKRLGADVVLAPEEAVGKILGLTGGKGVDVAIEALGKQVTLESAARVTRLGGVVSSVGVYSLHPTVALPTDGTFIDRHLVTTLCPGGSDRLRRMMDVVRYGKVDLTPLFTHAMKLADTPAAYDLFRGRRDGVIKIALRP
ncbi:MAG: alcohol dehydrogenase catalytic domain-containing protein [Deltaproteobacteria bacterium]|nr:alcohol dehydrogenase catalytic domain-containing protein [Deltaproteobacteria bacterium]